MGYMFHAYTHMFGKIYSIFHFLLETNTIVDEQLQELQVNSYRRKWLPIISLIRNKTVQ